MSGSVLRWLAVLCAVGALSTSGCALSPSGPDAAKAGASGLGGAGAESGAGGAGGSKAGAGGSTSGAGGARGGSGGSAAGGASGGTAGSAEGGDAGAADCDARNDCGGCGTLSAAIGEACGRCGTYECRADGSDVTCADPGFNACDGCGELSQEPGESCGECGTYACNADGSDVSCDDPGLNACDGCGQIEVPPGTSCGACGPYECSSDKSTTVCSGMNVNACGGCGTLEATPGSSCGECGTYACSPDKSSVACDDPGQNACGGCGVLAAAVGSACGQCGTYECSSDLRRVSCDDPGFNACGGCGVLTAAPGASCGACGTYVCNGANTSVTCNDAGENACGGCGALSGNPGAACGDCGRYACSSDKRSVSCAGDTTRVNCSNNAPQECNATGRWSTGATCSGATPRCIDGECYACNAASDCPAPKANGCLRPVCTASHTCDFVNESSGTPCPAGGTCNTSGSCVRSPVTVDSYNVDATEVTVGQYAAFLAAKGSNTSGQPAYCSWNTTYQPESDWPRTAEYNDMPVAWVDWCDAYAYCKWAGRRLCGKIGGGSNGLDDYDDPTLSQWMHACSGASNRLYPYGNTYSATRCNGAAAQIGTAVAVGAKSTCVGGYSGLFDMSGNVWEFEDSCTASSGSSDICRWRGGTYVQTRDDASGLFLQCDTNNNNTRAETDSSAGFRCCSN